MMLDADFLIAVEQHDHRTQAVKVSAQRRGRKLHTTGLVVAQVWRGGANQARLASFIKTLVVHPFHDPRDSRQPAYRVGELLAASPTRDVVDAHLVLTANRLFLDVLTGDPDDLGPIAKALPNGPTIKAWPPRKAGGVKAG